LFILCVAVILSALIYAISGIVIQRHREIVIHAATEEATLKAKHSSHLIADFIQERLNIIGSIISWINPFWVVSPKTFKQDIVKNIKQVLKRYPGIDSIHFLNRYGVFACGVPEARSLEGVNLLRDVENPGEYKALLEKIRRQGSSALAPLMITQFNPLSGKLEKAAVLLVIAPLFRNETYLGALIAILRWDAIGKQFFPALKTINTNSWLIVNKNGLPLYADTTVSNQVSFIRECRIKQYLKKSSGFAILRQDKEGGEAEPLLVSYSKLPLNTKNNWYVIRAQSLAPLETDMRHWLLQTRLFAFGAIGIMLLSAILMLLANQRSESRLNTLNKKYVDLLDNLMVGTFSFNKSGHIDYVNRRACEILGYTPEELLGKDRLFFAWEKDRAKVESISNQRLSGKRMAESYRSHMIHKSGKVMDVEIYASPILDTRGEVQGIRVMFQDITHETAMERELQTYTKHLEELVKQRTHALEDSEALYRSIFNTSLAIIYIHQGDKFRIMNDAGKAFFGFETRKEMFQTNVWDTVPEGERQRRRENARRRLAGETVPQSYESLVINREGETRVVACNFQDITYKGTPAILAILFDITERKHLQAEISHTEKLKSMGNLATGIAHDFNNILTAILGRIQLLRKHPNDAEARKTCIRVVETAVEQGISTVKRIQEYTRVRQARDVSGLFPLHPLIDDVLEITRSSWKDQAQKKGATIQIVKNLQDKNLHVPSELREIFLNFILNAVDAMPQGGTLTISTRSRAMANGEKGVEIRFRDTGVGMSSEVAQRAQEPFFTTKGTEGSGLGLSIVAGIVERLKGTLDINSREGEGTEIILRLPIRPFDSPDSGKTASREGKKRLEKLMHGAILVIDDEPALLEIIKDLLTPEGIEVKTVTSGDKGISLFRKDAEKFSMIMTDLGMPGMNGWEVAREIRSLNTEIPIILMTGWGLEISNKEVKNAGITELVAKPFTIRKVQALVTKYLSKPASPSRL